MTEVVNEGIAGNHGLIAGLSGPQAKIVVLEVADAKLLVE